MQAGTPGTRAFPVQPTRLGAPTPSCRRGHERGGGRKRSSRPQDNPQGKTSLYAPCRIMCRSWWLGAMHGTAAVPHSFPSSAEFLLPKVVGRNSCMLESIHRHALRAKVVCRRWMPIAGGIISTVQMHQNGPVSASIGSPGCTELAHQLRYAEILTATDSPSASHRGRTLSMFLHTSQRLDSL